MSETKAGRGRRLRWSKWRSGDSARVLLLCGWLGSEPLAAAICTIPGTHSDLRCAVGDPTCSEIGLATGTYVVDRLPIARDLVLHGAGPGSTTISGLFIVTGATTDVSLVNLRIDATNATSGGCAEAALSVSGGAHVASGGGLEALDRPPTGACRLFADGFETASICAWSLAAP